MSNKKRSPWAWIPSLYFAEGLPYVAVMTISVIMYKRLGISNADIALYTSWLYLPWVIKPFWSPFVDLLKTKRWWVVTMQVLLGAGFAGIAFTIPVPMFFQTTLAIFWLIGFSSATHDIAADGYYMLALDTHTQAMYVGIRSTFYRVATIAGQGLLVILAGALESGTGLKPVSFEIKAGPEYTNNISLPLEDTSALKQLPANTANYEFNVYPPVVNLSTQKIASDSAAKLKTLVHGYNLANGFIPEEKKIEEKEKGTSAWAKYISGPLGRFLKRNFGKADASDNKLALTGSLAVVQVKLNKAPEKGETLVLNTSLDKGDKSLAVVQGDRIEFSSENWDKPAYLLVQADSKLAEATSATYKGLSGNIKFAWSITFFILAGFFVALSLYHKFILPKPDSDKPARDVTASNIFKEFFATFGTFFKKKQIWIAIPFLLLYRFPEAQLIKLISPFLLDAREAGGLGLTTGEVGLVYGTVGILGLTIGGIIGGLIAAKGGLKKWLWPMAWSISLTCATFVYLGVFQPQNLLVINLAVFVEQFGYGFGFTAYMLFMIYMSEGEHKTAHYAICTAFMALGMMLPGMAAGWLQEMIGYENFFWWVMICCAFTIIVTAFVKVDENFGRKQVKASA
jgi:PAT family beta-lactamase induction signal transducer AmpG